MLSNKDTLERVYYSPSNWFNIKIRILMLKGFFRIIYQTKDREFFCCLFTFSVIKVIGKYDLIAKL